MGFFSKKILLAQLRIGLADNKRVYVSIKSIPDKNGHTLFPDSKLPFIIYMFFLDRVLFALSDEVATGTLTRVHTWGTEFMNKIGKLLEMGVARDLPFPSSPAEWEERRSELKTPNEWTFTELEGYFVNSHFKATAKLYSKDDRVFCQTDFTRAPVVEAQANLYLLVEALLFFLTQKSDFEDYAYYFLPALLAQCSSYAGKRPGLTQIGQAVQHGMMYAEEFSQKRRMSQNEALEGTFGSRYDRVDVIPKGHAPDVSTKAKTLIERYLELELDTRLQSNLIHPYFVQHCVHPVAKDMTPAVLKHVPETQQIFVGEAGRNELRKELGGTILDGYVAGLLSFEPLPKEPPIMRVPDEDRERVLLQIEKRWHELKINISQEVEEFLSALVEMILSGTLSSGKKFNLIKDTKGIGSYLFLMLVNGVQWARAEHDELTLYLETREGVSLETKAFRNYDLSEIDSEIPKRFVYPYFLDHCVDPTLKKMVPQFLKQNPEIQELFNTDEELHRLRDALAKIIIYAYWFRSTVRLGTKHFMDEVPESRRNQIICEIEKRMQPYEVPESWIGMSKGILRKGGIERFPDSAAMIKFLALMLGYGHGWAIIEEKVIREYGFGPRVLPDWDDRKQDFPDNSKNMKLDLDTQQLLATKSALPSSQDLETVRKSVANTSSNDIFLALGSLNFFCWILASRQSSIRLDYATRENISSMIPSILAESYVKTYWTSNSNPETVRLNIINKTSQLIAAWKNNQDQEPHAYWYVGKQVLIGLQGNSATLDPTQIKLMSELIRISALAYFDALEAIQNQIP